MSFLERNREIIRRVIRLTVLLIVVIYFPIIMTKVNAEKHETVCQKVKSRVLTTSENILLTDKGLESIVRNAFPALEGTKVDEMNLYEMEREIEQLPVVLRCEMYTTVGGILHVEIEQREPIMRVFKESGSYYMDENAYRITATGDMHSNCVVVNGNVGDLLDGGDLVELCKYIDGNKFWRAQIEQIYVTKDKEFLLIPRLGDHIIEFGDIERMEEKFENLYALYTRGWDSHEWNEYKSVNLKYRNQVVCTKK